MRAVELTGQGFEAMRVAERPAVKVARGEVKPRIARVFPLSQPAEAQTYLASREAMGKIVITP